jgi:capsule polysaccharide export protein KpsC/LpsZ
MKNQRIGRFHRGNRSPYFSIYYNDIYITYDVYRNKITKRDVLELRYDNIKECINKRNELIEMWRRFHEEYNKAIK